MINNEENLVSDEKKAWKKLVVIVLVLIMILILVFYLVLPSNIIGFTTYTNHNNFSINNSKSDFQFFDNMRYIDSNISYKIHDCTIKKRNDMNRAFDILENMTILNFYSVENNPEISVFCQEKAKTNDVLFIAGEGGPTNVTHLDGSVLINHGKILLIRDSGCSRPNIAIHELLHTLGFKHSKNPNNIMFNITSCEQRIGDQLINYINNLYSYPSKPDLFFFNISAEIENSYLSTQFLIENKGFKDSEESKIEVYANDEIIFEYELDSLSSGDGMLVSVDKIRVPFNEIYQLKYNINSAFQESNKDNNLVILNKTHSHLTYTSILDKIE
ncbi:MAG: matrixin family metalloprotease [Nanoarchaeota archaeon]